jgi:predicted hydrocarbon binding protein
MASPQVPIDVDPATGIWSTDGLPMIYMPRHFFVNYYSAMDEALGREKHQAMLFAASHKSAMQWSAAEAKTHGLRDVAVFRHYLNRLSQRGWATFIIESVDLAGPSARVRVGNSVYGLQLGRTGRTECAMFAGSLAGCLEWAATDAGRPARMTAHETQCIAQGHAHCAFEVMRAK